MRFITFYSICFLLLQFENFANGMINSASLLTKPSTSHGNMNEEKEKAIKKEENISITNLERNGKKILFVARNISFSNYQIFVNLANKLSDSGYIVHLIIADEFSEWIQRKSELDLPKINPEIVYISIPMDNKLTFCQTIFKNPIVKIKGEDQRIAKWLSGQNYSLGMADIEMKSTLEIFDLLQIRGSILVSVPPLHSIYLHLLGMSLPKAIPAEFSPAIPGDGNGKSGIRDDDSERQTENIKEYKHLIQLEDLRQSIKPSQFARQVRYVLVNQHPLVQFHPRNWSPYVKFIGGIHVEEFAHKLKGHENKKLLYPKSDCLILYSVGTINHIGLPGPEFVNNVLSAFAAHPKCHFIMSNFDEQRTRMTEENKQILQQNKNIEIVKKFIQQRDILAQPNLRLFISHCGQNSLNEAVYLGVPLICIPFYFDQFHNAAIVEYLGNGKFLTWQDIGKTLSEALNEMLEIKYNKYRKIAQKLRKMILGYPKRSNEFISVIDKAILELEGNEKPNLTAVKSITRGWLFDNPSLDDNFVKI